MELDLESSIAQLRHDFLTAASEDEDAVAAFQHHLKDVSHRAQLTGSQHLIDSVVEASRFILAEARNMRCFGSSSDNVLASYTGPLPGLEEEELLEEADPHTQALHDWFVDNITHPFPTVGDMQRLAVACCAAGLEDSDAASVDAWFIRQRQVSGWNRIADKYCGGNLDDMRLLCASLLRRPREECAEDEMLDKEAVEDVFDMSDEVSFACGRLECEVSPWVEALEGRFEEMEEDDESEAETEVEVEAVLDLYDADCDSTIDADDQDEDMIDEPAPSISWSPVLKRKREELENDLPPRSLRRTNSTSSSDSSYSTASFSSFSGSSASSDTSVEDDCDDDLRPTKRQRNVSGTPEPAPSALPSPPQAMVDVATMDQNSGDSLLEDPFYSPTPEQRAEVWSIRKRKHEDLEDDDASQTAKRPRFSSESTRVPPLPQGTAVAVGATRRLDWSARSIRNATRSFVDGSLDLDLMTVSSWPLIVDQDLTNFMKWIDRGHAPRDAPFAGSHIANACAALDGELPSKEDEERSFTHPIPTTNVTISLNSIDAGTLQNYVGLQRQFSAPVEAWRAKLMHASELHPIFRGGPFMSTATPPETLSFPAERSSLTSLYERPPSSLPFARSSSPSSTDGRSTPSLISDDSDLDSDVSTLPSPRMIDEDMESDESSVASDAETDDDQDGDIASDEVADAMQSIMARRLQQRRLVAAAQWKRRAMLAFMPSTYTATLGAPLPVPAISVPTAMQMEKAFLPSTYTATLGAPLPTFIPSTPTFAVHQRQLSPAALAALQERVARLKFRRTADTS